LVWVNFILCILIILFAGRAVAKYGDIIARKTGFGGLWIGLVLLAIVTSLPELFTGISAVTIVKAPDLTIGDLLGANTFNLLNLALLDIACQQGSLFRMISPRLRVIALFSIALVFITGLSIFISSHFSPMGIGWIGLYTPVIIILYLLFARVIFRSEQNVSKEAESDYGGMLLKRVYLYFGIAAAFIIGAGIWLALIGNEIANTYEWASQSFVGSLFLAFTTSLPEITVSFAAMRLGALDMAAANMIASNLFNMTIVSIDDLFYLQGPVLAAVSEKHVITALVVIGMTGLFILGLKLRPKKFFRLSWINVTMIALFLVGACLSFTPA